MRFSGRSDVIPSACAGWTPVSFSRPVRLSNSSFFRATSFTGFRPRSGTLLASSWKLAITQKSGILAEIASHLQAAVDFASPWSGKAVLGSFSDLLRTIQRMLLNPIEVAPADAEWAVRLVAQFSDAQRRFDALAQQFSALSVALSDVWPDHWRGASEEAALRKHTGDFERVADSMRSSSDLSFDNLHEGNAFLADCIARLEGLLETARGRDTRRSIRSRSWREGFSAPSG